MKRSEAQKQRPHELLWMLWFDEKSVSSYSTFFFKNINTRCKNEFQIVARKFQLRKWWMFECTFTNILTDITSCLGLGCCYKIEMHRKWVPGIFLTSIRVLGSSTLHKPHKPFIFVIGKFILHFVPIFFLSSGKTKNSIFFIFQKYGKFWSILLGHFIVK